MGGSVYLQQLSVMLWYSNWRPLLFRGWFRYQIFEFWFSREIPGKIKVRPFSHPCNAAPRELLVLTFFYAFAGLMLHCFTKKPFFEPIIFMILKQTQCSFKKWFYPKFQNLAWEVVWVRERPAQRSLISIWWWYWGHWYVGILLWHCNGYWIVTSSNIYNIGYLKVDQ